MKMRARFGLMATLLVGLATASRPASARVVEKIAAVVGSNVILASEV